MRRTLCRSLSICLYKFFLTVTLGFSSMGFASKTEIQCRNLFPLPAEYVVKSAQPFRFSTYLWQKIGDFSYVDKNLLDQGRLRMKIFWSKNKTERVEPIKLSQLISIHSIDAPGAQEKTEDRIQQLRANWDPIVKLGLLTLEMQNAIIPSKAPIRTYYTKKYGYVVFDGNGRVAAIQKAFNLFPDLPVEVLVFRSDDPEIELFIEEIMLDNGQVTSTND